MATVPYFPFVSSLGRRPLALLQAVLVRAIFTYAELLLGELSEFYLLCSFCSHLLSHMKVSIFPRFFPTVCATPKTPTASWAFVLSSMFCSTTPTPSDVAPVFQSSAQGTAITLPSLFLTKWHQSVLILRRNRPTLQLPLKGPFQLCCTPTLSCRCKKP